jgi:hypothetical protein
MQDARHANMSDHHSRHGTFLVRGVQLIMGAHTARILLSVIFVPWFGNSFSCCSGERGSFFNGGDYYLLSQQLEGGGHGLMNI